MIAEPLRHEEIHEFIDYCARHRSEVDDSFLNDQDLADFILNDENPTFIVREAGSIVAVASLIIDDHHRRGRNGRLRIFHSETGDIKAYSLLLSEMMTYKEELDNVFLFVPFANKALASDMERLNFSIQRYVFVMVNEMKEIPPIDLPDGYSIRLFQPGRDESVWCHIRNTAFEQLKGNATPITPEMVHNLVSQPDYLEGGLMLLMHDGKPVGVVRGSGEMYEGVPAMNIGPIAILPEYQGKGLGKQLLRTALKFAENMNYKKTMLCVNAENAQAMKLYLREGFVQAEGVVAYEYFLR